MLELERLSVRFLLGREAEVRAVTDATLQLRPGRVLALVGESGCGKSVLASALLGLLPGNAEVRGRAVLRADAASRGKAVVPERAGMSERAGVREGAEVRGKAMVRGSAEAAGNGEPDVVRGIAELSGGAGVRSAVEAPEGPAAVAASESPQAPGGIELLSAPESVLSGQVRGRMVGLVPQSASTHLTPVRTARSQLVETIRALGGELDADALAERVGLAPAALDRYPHELSGGMAQRVALALALAGDPQLILADEPTTGLDRPLVHRTVDLLAESATEGRAVLLITHDLAAARRVATDVAVMYASRVVEAGPAAEVLADPWHPYTAGLLAALPDGGFRPIPGHPPALTELDRIEQEWGCVFCQRCPDVPGFAPCTGDPELIDHGGRWVAAHPPC